LKTEPGKIWFNKQRQKNDKAALPDIKAIDHFLLTD